ncbi:hypothetical protein LTR08_005430 [Meristemomyces frigidus]|nr:hypothetical protein LTR08_005430 [Meristemomyces frigidus]
MVTASRTTDPRDARVPVSVAGELKAEEAAQAIEPLSFQEGDPDDPKNWPKQLRWALTILLSCFTLISPMSSSTVAPALDVVKRGLHIPSPSRKQLALSIFVLFHGVGPHLVRPADRQALTSRKAILAPFSFYLYGTIIVIGGLNYLSLGLGYVLGSQLCAFSVDKIYRKLKSRDNSDKPEYKLPLAIFGAFLVPCGLFMYA